MNLWIGTMPESKAGGGAEFMTFVVALVGESNR